jgi:hypothetical protein
LIFLIFLLLLSLGLYKAQIFACLGYSDQNGNNRNCWQYFTANNTWAYLSQSNYVHPWRPGKIHQNFVYFIDNVNPEKYDMNTNEWSSGLSAPIATGIVGVGGGGGRVAFNFALYILKNFCK